MVVFESIQQIIDKMDFKSITSSRKEELGLLVQFVQNKQDGGLPIALNFICTHNSRRSQFSQVWAKVAADYFGVKMDSYSGGVEVTAFNERAITSLKKFGFEITSKGQVNPIYSIKWSNNSEILHMFSKLYDDAINPKAGFAAIMTCSHADENCPVVTGCEKRIPIRYKDPKQYDDTPLESAFYDYRSFEIATELFYIFSLIK